MGTRSHIGIEHADDTVEYIYVHWDGHIDTLGVSLMGFYSTKELLQPLINLGDCSQVSDLLEDCVAYHRDKNEDREQTKAYAVDGREKFYEDTETMMYLLTKDNEWLVRGGGYDGSLATAMKEVCDL